MGISQFIVEKLRNQTQHAKARRRCCIVGLSIAAVVIMILVPVLVLVAKKSNVTAEETAWQWFVNEYDKVYADANEEAYRFEVFVQNYVNTLQPLQTQNNYWGLTTFMDWTVEEFKHLLGSQVHPNYTGFNYSATVLSGLLTWNTSDPINWAGSNNPLGQPMVSAIKNQYSCGACWAVASSETAESSYGIFQDLAHHRVPDLAAEQVLSCAYQAFAVPNNGCGGGYVPEAIQFILTEGQQPAADYSDWVGFRDYYLSSPGSCPTNMEQLVQYRFNGLCQVQAQGEEATIEMLSKYGPVTVSVAAESWQFWKTPSVYTDAASCSADPLQADHAVQLVGWDTDVSNGQQYWLLKNSWGTDWGDQGYLRILKDHQNVCGVTNSVYGIAPCSNQ